jgi:hypothetical protein
LLSKSKSAPLKVLSVIGRDLKKTKKTVQTKNKTGGFVLLRSNNRKTNSLICSLFEGLQRREEKKRKKKEKNNKKRQKTA